MSSAIITFDVGGLGLKWALFDKEKNIVDRGRCDYQLLTLNDIYHKIVDVYCACLKSKKYQINKMGIATSGVVDSKRGMIMSLVDKDMPLKGNAVAELLCGIDIPVYIENDARSGMIGELFNNNFAQENDSMLFLTVGTALGGAVFVNNQICYGANFMAGEIGCGLFDLSGPLSQKNISNNCGWYGAMGLYAMKKNLAIENVSGKMIYEQMLKGDVDAKTVYNGLIVNLAKLIFNANCLMNFDCIVIGGAVSENAAFIKNVDDAVAAIYGHFNIYKNFKVKAALLHNDSNLYGAYELAKNNGNLKFIKKQK